MVNLLSFSISQNLIVHKYFFSLTLVIHKSSSCISLAKMPRELIDQLKVIVIDKGNFSVTQRH